MGFEADGELLLRELVLQCRQHPSGDLAEILTPDLVGPQAGFHLREVEDVVDQARQLARLAVDDAVILLRAVGVVEASELQRLGK